MRVLFTSLAAVGHVAPLSAVAAELAERGHTIGWAAHRAVRGHLRPHEARRFDVDAPGDLRPQQPERPMAFARRYFSKVLPRATHAMMPGVRDAIDAFAPDVVVVEQNCLAGSIAARLAGLPWVCVHVTPILLLRPFRQLPGVEAWIDAQVGQAQRAHGVAPLPWPPRSPRTLIASSRAFLGPDADLREGDLPVGALVPTELATLDDSWLGPRPRVLVSLGTETGPRGDAFVRHAIAALPDTGSAIVVGPPDLEAPPHVQVAPWVPQPALMPHLDAVLTHGGQNTVTEALLHGVPLVAAPVQYDQPAVAARVAALGAGLRVSFEDASVEVLREALHRVLTEPAFAAEARRVGASLGPGTAEAADVILGAAA